MLRALLLGPVLLLFAACGGDSSTTGRPVGGGTGPRPRVAVIPKGTTHMFWQTVRAGAMAAGDRLGLDVQFKGPLRENDRAQQIQLVQQFVGDGVAAIALAPLDRTALVPAVALCKQHGVPVVIFDSALDGEVGRDFQSFVATDNEKSGALAGRELAALVQQRGGGNKVVLLRYEVGSASTEARERGFLQAARAAGLEITVDNRYAGVTAGEAKTAALNLADELRAADGVFCPCEPVTVGMLLALDQLGLAGKLAFAGFDATPPLLQALRDGKLAGIVVQDPRRMGEVSVEHLRRLVDGQTVEQVVDTGAVWVTADNMDRPEVQALLR